MLSFSWGNPDRAVESCRKLLEQPGIFSWRNARITRWPIAAFNGPGWTGLTGPWIGSTKSGRAKEAIRRRFGWCSRTGQKAKFLFGSSPVDPRNWRTIIANWGSGGAIASWSCWGMCFPLWNTVLALIKLGAVIVPTTPLLGENDLAERLERGRIGHIVCAADGVSRFGHLGKQCTRIVVGGSIPGWHAYEDHSGASAEFKPDGETRASDPMQLYFTSGTTAKPKLVMQTQVTYPVGHLSTMYWIGVQPGDIHCNISSPGWAKHAWSCFFAPWNAEATVFVPNQSRFNAKGLLETITRNKVTTLCAPPTVWRMLVTQPLGEYQTKLRELVSAGEPLNPEIIEQVQAVWGLTIRDGYGQTESTAVAGNPPGQRIKTGSLGRALPGFRPILLNPSDQETSEGEFCLELEPRPLGLMPGYQNEDGSLSALKGKVHRTGDLMSRDADGYFTFVGRADDVFKASDYRISPFELESALIEHSEVVECAVVPSPDPIRSAVPKAFVVLRSGVEPSRAVALSIFQHIRKVLPPYYRIRRIEFSDLPKTISGKIRRIELRLSEAANIDRRFPAEIRIPGGGFSGTRV